MVKLITPKPLIDSIQHFADANHNELFNHNDYHLVTNFLTMYNGNNATFESYRRELERLLQWSWFIAKKSLLDLSREDMEHYIHFCLKPPKEWIGKKRVTRFIDKNGQRKPNPEWRPFVVKVSKQSFKQGKRARITSYQVSQSSLRALFAILGSFYDYLLLEEKVPKNPIAMIRQKSRYLQKNQQQPQVIRLSDTQWQTCRKVAEKMAKENPVTHQRTLFILTAMYLMYLRISEFVASDRWTPLMNHFYKDSNDHWWFKTIGKGNKLRNIAVSDDMLEVFMDYREALNLPPLPSSTENLPLIPKIKGNGAVESSRQIRRLIQDCFDRAVAKLRQTNQNNEADILETATVHWLRHTGISDDVNKRHRSILHVRDDAGHNSIATAERYSDVELQERYKSAQNKKANIASEKRSPK